MFRSIFTKTMTIKYVIIKHQLIDWNRVGSRHFHVLVYIMPWHFWWLTLEGFFFYTVALALHWVRRPRSSQKGI